MTTEMEVKIWRTKPKVAVAVAMSLGWTLVWRAIKGAWKLGPGYRVSFGHSKMMGEGVLTNANSSNNLEDNQFSPTAVGLEVDKESEAQDKEDHSEPDCRQVLTRLADEDTSGHGGKGKRQSLGKNIDTGQKRCRTTSSLEVQWQVVGS